MSALALLLASLVGLSLGLLGGGGSVLMVPILVYVAKMPAKEAIALSLPIVGLASVVGALRHWRAGNVDMRTALIFAGPAMIAAFGAAQLARFVTGSLQLSLLALVMLAAAISMLRSAMSDGPEGRERRLSSRWLPVVAIGVGGLTGLVGVGGGFLIVPALVLIAGVPMRLAVGTSLVVIAINAFAGFAGSLGEIDLPWTYGSAFAAITVAGIFGGTALSSRVPPPLLKQAFAVLLLFVSTLMLYQNRASLLH